MLLAEIQVTIARVKKMEQYLDETLAELCIEEGSVTGISGDAELVWHHIEKLREYCDSGLWLHDYECDERGELPADLKRGVLAEDTLYNLLKTLNNEVEELEMQHMLIGKCGFYCGACPTYIANNCNGCMEEHIAGDCFSRDCVIEKGLDFCGQCTNFPCDDIINKPHSTVLDKEWLLWKRNSNTNR